MNLIDLLEAYVKKHLRFGAVSTVRQYHTTLRHVARRIGRTPTLDDLNDDTVADLMQWFLSRGRTVAGANKARSNLHTLWTFAARRGLVTQWPDTKRLCVPERVPVGWEREELAMLFAALAKQTGTISGIPAAKWWLTLHAVCWETGERIGAVTQLLRERVNLTTGRIVYLAESRKGKRRDVEHRLHPDTVAALREIWLPARKLVFPWPFDPTYLWTRYKRLREQAGLATDRLHSFHCMRRTSASFFEAAGGDATAWLDHASRATTKKHYLVPSIVDRMQPAACDVLFRPGATSAGAN